MTKQQLHHEIRWLQQEIEKLRLLLPKKTSVIKQIHEYERQIRCTEVNIAFGRTPMSKTGNFETDVNSGFYRWERNNTQARTFDSDFRAWLLTKGVPEKYVDRVVSAAYERGHAYGEEEIVSSSWSFIGIFE